MELFKLCYCDNITNSHTAHYKQKQITTAIRKSRTMWMTPKKNATCFASSEIFWKCLIDNNARAHISLDKAHTPRNSTQNSMNISGGSKGGARGTRAPPTQNLLIFMQFSGKIGQIIRLVAPPLRLAPPPLGNPGSATEYEVVADKFSRTKVCGWERFHFNQNELKNWLKRIGFGLTFSVTIIWSIKDVLRSPFIKILCLKNAIFTYTFNWTKYLYFNSEKIQTQPLVIGSGEESYTRWIIVPSKHIKGMLGCYLIYERNSSSLSTRPCRFFDFTLCKHSTRYWVVGRLSPIYLKHVSEKTDKRVTHGWI